MATRTMRGDKVQVQGGGHTARPFSTEALSHIVELARDELRARGMPEDQIEALLRRRHAYEDLWDPAGR